MAIDKAKMKCTYSKKDCENVEMVLDLLDPPKNTSKFEKVYDINGKDTLTTNLVSTTSEAVYNRADVCKKAHGTLCWFGKLPTGKYRGWNYKHATSQKYQTYDLNDPKAKGQGFPTEDVCLEEMGGLLARDGTCAKGLCDVSEKEAACACSQYKDVPQFNDPCKFLEVNCDERSIAYTEAQFKIKQADVAVGDIVTIGDAERFLNDLDALADKLP